MYIRNVKIKRVHRVGKSAKSTCRAIVEKCSSYEVKEHVFGEAKKQKITDILVYKNFQRGSWKCKENSRKWSKY